MRHIQARNNAAMHGGRNELVNGITDLFDGIVFEEPGYVDIAADQNRGRVANIMHVGAPTTARTIALAEHAAGVGMESICCVPPFFYVPSDDQVVEYYKAVGAAADADRRL